MSAEKRPGGLTAMAVLNFVFGAFGCISALVMVVILALVLFGSEALEKADSEAFQQFQETIKAVGLGAFGLMTALVAVSTVLQILSGIGYLKQRKFLGRTLGNAYALTSIAATLVQLALPGKEETAGPGIGILVSIIYPVLTLILLNTTFKEDFIH